MQFEAAIRKTNVLIITGDPLGNKMAGPGIRAVNFAQQISKYCNVHLVTTNSCSFIANDYEVSAIRDKVAMQGLEDWSDVLVVQGTALLDFPFLKKTKKYLVCDLYDPMHLEQLEQGKDLNFSKWNARITHANYIMRSQLEVGDFFLAATKRQRDFWLGSLANLGRVNAATYDADPNLNSLIALVPFGFPDEDPKHVTELLRTSSRGITPNDKVIIWAGGVYNWFDPLTLVAAINRLATKHPDVKLFFMGTQHPHSGVPEMEMLNQTRSLTAELGIEGKHVFFNESWVSYEDRKEYLLSADAGVSTHFEHIETRFSFRTRILDYLWADLPIVTTKGDYFADLVDEFKLGITVPEGNMEALADAIEKVLYDERFAETCRDNIRRCRNDFFWSNVTLALVSFCREPHYAADLSLKTRHGRIERLRMPPSKGPFLFLKRKLYTIEINYVKEGLRGIWSLITRKLLCK